jgi:hypothetical protein
VRVLCVAPFIKFEEAEGKTDMALKAAAGATAEAHVAGSGYEATAAALGPAMRALTNSVGLGLAHFGALAGVGKGQRVRTACKCFTKFRLLLIRPTHKRTEGRAPVWSSEFTTKPLHYGGFQQISLLGKSEVLGSAWW